ncbi:Radical SAM domain protein [Methanotorris igneus Kol 5]|uniref:Radical SAM domain protein n=2 Tax=Methanotorris igneus TaxID=2189 RepID=F6BAM6_METIK|nr:radical SAM protein [Methanotorris igneus]AEF95840.1 Radical SAM domain protein [Methanotorris igneus Kol 5]
MKTISLCPICLKQISAEIKEEDGKVIIEKKCPEHGHFKDIYWGDAELYKKFNKYEYIGSIEVTNTNIEKGCPYDCGLCPNHTSTTILANIDVTNRCNLNCPICFANANHTKKIYEPTFEEIKEMMKLLRNENPPCPAIQFAGGEPTVRDDLPELIKLAREMGFIHIQIATNGVKLKNLTYLKTLKEAGLSTIYLQFDGVTEKPYLISRNRNLLPTKLKVIENCRKIGFNSVVLVPTLAKGINDDQVGSLIKFAMENIDVVRSVNFQPVSFTGRIDESKRLKHRITIPDFIKLVEEQTNGEISKEDFYPVPFVVPISLFVDTWTNMTKVKLSCHQHCGAATYVFVEDGKLIPITRFFDVEGFIELLNEAKEDLISSKLGKAKAILHIAKELPKLMDKSKAPKNLKLIELIVEILKGNYDALTNFHYNTLMIGCMHFMDPYNYDVNRVKRCVIHYATPDGRIIPFCAYNTIHRKEVEEKFSIPIEEWKERLKNRDENRGNKSISDQLVV